MPSNVRRLGPTRMLLAVVAAACVACSVAVANSEAASAKQIRGTPRADTLLGTASADRIVGLGGNDRLFGRGGRDALLGGAGVDRLDGGPGVDQLRCGPGRDVAVVTRGDITVGCETRLGVATTPPVPVPVAGPVTGRAVPALAEIDRQLPRLLREWKVPGGAVAVAKNGRLVFARGYGYADREGQQPVQPDALFRIASVSKPITAVAILKLVEAGLLSLDTKAYPLRPDLLPPPGMTTADPRVYDVTVRQLLWHAGGWDRAGPGGFDPLFMPDEIARVVGVPTPASVETIMRYMLSRPLDFAPGSRFAYSNFGYAVLGRVVEKVSGVSYEQYVKSAVLGPAGATRMQLGRSLEAGRWPGEVRYYDDRATVPSVFPGGGTVPLPYGGFYLEAADSAGGWVASTVDLLRFVTAVDGLPSRGDILSASSIQRMTAAPSFAQNASIYYGMGWDVFRDSDEWRHGGSLPGTAALLVRSSRGVAWAALFNANTDEFFARQVDQTIRVALNDVRAWPAHDLFAEMP